MAMVDKCFPDDSGELDPGSAPGGWRCSSRVSSVPGVKEDIAPPRPGMPGDFPVYLRLPYRRDSYFCFKQEAKRDRFLSILSDCIRHQNQGEVTRGWRLGGEAGLSSVLRWGTVEPSLSPGLPGAAVVTTTTRGC